MFPITLKWVDHMYDKIESVCNQVEDIVSKEQESSKYVKGLKNVGNNVKEFCSTMDPLQYAEDQLTNLGATVEQLCSIVVPSSMDTMLSAVNNIFPPKDADSTACTNPELNDSVAEPVASVDMNEEVASVDINEEVASTEKLENLKLDLEDTTQTDQSFEEDPSPIYDEFGIDIGPNTGYCSPGHIAQVEPKEITQSPQKTQLDESCVVIYINDWFTSHVSGDTESSKIKTSSSTSKLGNFRRHMQKITKSKSSIIMKPLIIKEEPAFSLPVTSSNHDSWESEWEII